MIEFSSLKELPKHFSKLQSEIENPKKDRKGVHNAKYAQLDVVLDVIKKVAPKHGFSVTQLPFNDGDIFGIETLLMHDSGEWIKSRYGSKMASLNPQDYGKAITYYRRYALGALFNIAPEDDDDADSLIPQKSYQKKTNNNATRLATDGQKKFLYSLMGQQLYNENKTFIEKQMTFDQASKKIEELKGE